MGRRLWKGECIKGDVKTLNRYGETLKDDGNDLNGDGERQEGVRGQRKSDNGRHRSIEEN